jgi:hypothetical protein
MSKEAAQIRRTTARERWLQLPEDEREGFFVLVYADYLRLTNSRYHQPNCAKCSAPCAACGGKMEAGVSNVAREAVPEELRATMRDNQAALEEMMTEKAKPSVDQAKFGG